MHNTATTNISCYLHIPRKINVRNYQMNYFSIKLSTLNVKMLVFLFFGTLKYEGEVIPLSPTRGQQYELFLLHRSLYFIMT